MSPKVALERAQLKGKKAYRNDNWDVVDAVENNGKFLEQASDDKLPAEMRSKALAEKQQIVAASAERERAISGSSGSGARGEAP